MALALMSKNMGLMDTVKQAIFPQSLESVTVTQYLPGWVAVYVCPGIIPSQV